MARLYVESFNGRLRDECLNENRFDDVAEPPHSVGVAQTQT